MMPGLSFQIAGALALSGILAAMASGMREPTPAPAPVATAVAKPVFAERFDVPNEPAVLKKADRLKIEQPVPVATSDPVPVKTESIVLARPDQPVEVKPVARKKTTKREVRHDVCTRHHMHKVVTRGGRSWRCRR
jgi:hypothetical protein